MRRCYLAGFTAICAASTFSPSRTLPARILVLLRFKFWRTRKMGSRSGLWHVPDGRIGLPTERSYFLLRIRNAQPRCIHHGLRMRLSPDLLLRMYSVSPGASSCITARSGNLFASETVPGTWSVHHSSVRCEYRVPQCSDIPRFLTIYSSSSCADVQFSARTSISIDIPISRC